MNIEEWEKKVQQQTFSDKYSMSVEQNIFVAKRSVIDYIWKSANLEGISVTYPQTDAIYNGLSVANMKVDDIVAINNLKKAWRFILETVDYPTDYALICKINQYVGGNNLVYNAGRLRTVPVNMGGTTWKPDFPIESQIKEELSEILGNEENSVTKTSITLMLYCMRKQMFLDGNKRTSMLAANHYMITHGAGIIEVPLPAQPVFKELLIKYYETNDMTDIMRFIYDNCIDGIQFENEKEKSSDKELQ